MHAYVSTNVIHAPTHPPTHTKVRTRISAHSETKTKSGLVFVCSSDRFAPQHQD